MLEILEEVTCHEGYGCTGKECFLTQSHLYSLYREIIRSLIEDKQMDYAEKQFKRVNQFFYSKINKIKNEFLAKKRREYEEERIKQFLLTEEKEREDSKLSVDQGIGLDKIFNSNWYN